MPVLRYRFNYANKTLTHTTQGEQVGVYLRDGTLSYVRWLGFIDRSVARVLPNARPVKIHAEQYADDEIGYKWISIPSGHCIQGCLIDQGVFGVVETRVALVPPTNKKSPS